MTGRQTGRWAAQSNAACHVDVMALTLTKGCQPRCARGSPLLHWSKPVGMREAPLLDGRGSGLGGQFWDGHGWGRAGCGWTGRHAGPRRGQAPSRSRVVPIQPTRSLLALGLTFNRSASGRLEPPPPRSGCEVGQPALPFQDCAGLRSKDGKKRLA